MILFSKSAPHDAKIQRSSRRKPHLGSSVSKEFSLQNPEAVKFSRDLFPVLWPWTHDERYSKGVNCEVKVLYTRMLKNK